ncbi:MAG: sulfatase-like hydrolase/transferase [Candidatus Kapabacteria bacterium]|nr:sulfatase-like hydrolase/transferase [Candidatus Kapabacteria bacterium]
MMKVRNFRNLIVISQLYITFIFICTAFRLILFISEIDRLHSISSSFPNILLAFMQGVRFDIVIAGYILLLPFLVLTVMSVINRRSVIVDIVLRSFVFLAFSLVFLICASDIPYFGQFFQRFSVGAFQWADSLSFVSSMILQEPKYFLYAIPFLASTITLYYILRNIFNYKFESKPERGYFIKSIIGILALLLIIVGIRGRIHHKAPISVGTAYFCDDAFLNQLGLNPTFTLLRSYLDQLDERNSTIELMDDDLAINKVRSDMKIQTLFKSSPIARLVNYDSTKSAKMNVVIVIMESMSAAKMRRHGNDKELTPFLDSISNHGYYFENVYTSGIHTFSGIFSTLFSMPTIYRKHPMKEAVIKKYNGMATSLKLHGYSTAYFTTHDGQFDNVEGFLRHNDFDYVITEHDFPGHEVKSTLGVPDDVMFKYSISKLDNLHSERKPFFATFMTSSDHGPYYVPEYFHAKSKDIKLQCVEYADWSLRQFIKLASEKEWFENTLFVFVADHGAPLRADYDISLDYHHTPLLFYSPKNITNHNSYTQLGSQIDVFPTVMGLLKLPYLNNSLGIDLLSEERPFTILNNDDKIGVINHEYLLILKKDIRTLFRYSQNDKKNCCDEENQLADEMELYARSQLQTYQYLLKTNKLYINKEAAPTTELNLKIK